MTSLTTRQIVVEGTRSPVLIGAPEGADPSEAVVFVHGNPGSGSDWNTLLNDVAAHTQVIAPDMPGFAAAEMRRNIDYTVAGYARHLGGMLDQLGIERVHLVAHDFGGPWALTWAATAKPHRVASFTLINTGVLQDYRWHRLARIWRIPVLGELFQLAARRAAVRALLAHDNPGLSRSWAEHLTRLFLPAGTKRAILRLYRSTDVDALAELTDGLRVHDAPCQVIWGTADVYLPTEQAHRQTEVFPAAQVHLIEGAGHWVWLERPDEVADLVLPFLRRNVADWR